MRQRHLYHLVTPSPWPFITSITALLIPLGAVQYKHFTRGYATPSGFNKPIIITRNHELTIDVNALIEYIMQYFKSANKPDINLRELRDSMGDWRIGMPRECYQAVIPPNQPHLVDMELIKNPPWTGINEIAGRIREYNDAMINGVPPGKIEIFIKRYDDSVWREEQDNRRGKVLHEIYMDLENIVKEMKEMPNVNITNVDIIQKCKEVEVSLNNIKEKLSDLYMNPSIEHKSDELKPFSSSDLSEEVHQSSNYSNKSTVIQQILEATDTTTIYEIIAALPISSIAATIFMVICIVFTYVKTRAIMRLVGTYLTTRISLFYYKRRSNKLPKI